MDKKEAKQEIENLIEWIHTAQEKINILPNIAIFWHVLLGLCFTVSWRVQYFEVNQLLYQTALWAIIIGFGWLVTSVSVRRSHKKLHTLSTPRKQFTVFWIIQGVLLSIIGFSSSMESAMFQVYPFVFAILMASLYMTISLIFALPQVRWIVGFWCASALVSLLLEDFTQRYLVAGLSCFFALTLTYFLQKNSSQHVKRRQ